jgi:hypothetical protein
MVKLVKKVRTEPSGRKEAYEKLFNNGEKEHNHLTRRFMKEHFYETL